MRAEGFRERVRRGRFWTSSAIEFEIFAALCVQVWWHKWSTTSMAQFVDEMSKIDVRRDETVIAQRLRDQLPDNHSGMDPVAKHAAILSAIRDTARCHVMA